MEVALVVSGILFCLIAIVFWSAPGVVWQRSKVDWQLARARQSSAEHNYYYAFLSIL